MNRRNFFEIVAGLIGVATLPAVGLPEPVLPPKRNRLFLNKPVGISREALEDIKAWGVDSINEQTRREIFACGSIDRRFAADKECWG